MKRLPQGRRKGIGPITFSRSARLHHLVCLLSEGVSTRDELLARLQIGLRTFYRELELLRRCGVKFRRDAKRYEFRSTREEAEGLLPFPDPQLSFAEVRELASSSGAAGSRLAVLLESATRHQPVTASKPARAARGGGASKKKKG